MRWATSRTGFHQYGTMPRFALARWAERRHLFWPEPHVHTHHPSGQQSYQEQRIESPSHGPRQQRAAEHASEGDGALRVARERYGTRTPKECFYNSEISTARSVIFPAEQLRLVRIQFDTHKRHSEFEGVVCFARLCRVHLAS